MDKRQGTLGALPLPNQSLPSESRRGRGGCRRLLSLRIEHQGSAKTPPRITPASASPPRTLRGIGGTNQGAQLPGR